MVQALLRGYSVLFHGVLCLFCFAMAFVGWLVGSTQMTVDVLPWYGLELQMWLFGLSAIGLIATGLAATGKVKFLFLPWTLVVVGFVGRGLWATRYYDGPEDLQASLFFLVGALATVLGAISFLRQPSVKRR
jgi:hypothetical protein